MAYRRYRTGGALLASLGVSVWSRRRAVALTLLGVGAVIGGVGARLVSRSVVDALEEIFEEAPETLQGSARPAIED